MGDSKLLNHNDRVDKGVEFWFDKSGDPNNPFTRYSFCIVRSLNILIANYQREYFGNFQSEH